MNNGYASGKAAQELTGAYMNRGYTVNPVPNNGTMVLEIFRKSPGFKLGPIQIRRSREDLVGKLTIKSSLEHESWGLASLPEETGGLLKVIQHYAPKFKAAISVTNNL